MKKIPLVTFSLLFITITAMAKTSKYAVALLPDSLLEGAKMVVRESQEVLEINSIKSATYSVHRAYTLLNENAENSADLIVPYNKFRKISNITGYVYDKDGKQVKRIRQDEINDYSSISGFSVFDDNRVKYVDPGEYDYPYTVEYSFEVKIKDPFVFPSWSPVPDYLITIEQSSYTVITNNPDNFKYYESNLPESCTRTEDNGKTYFSWQVNALPVFEREDYALPSQELLPILHLAPIHYEVDGYEGSLESWSDFGKWVFRLNQDRKELSEEARLKIQHLTRSAKSDLEKTKILYEYLQNNTRYVSIQIGIGGWQPMKAQEVNDLAYGDCKALSNYLKAMLNEAGVTSYYTLVNSGSNEADLIASFPSPQFDHAILCVPIENDTVWLECTSQTNPFGYLGQFTDDRDVLLIKPEGGEIAHTKTYNMNENLKRSLIRVNLNEQGPAAAEIETTYQGVFYDQVKSILASDAQDQKKKMYNKFSFAGFTINTFSHEEIKSSLPAVIESVNIDLKNYCQTFGNRLIFCPNLLHGANLTPDEDTERNSDILFKRSYQTADSIVFSYPEEYRINQLPDAVFIESKFGKYSTEYIADASKIIYIRKKMIQRGVYNKEDYDELIDFYQQIAKADMIKLILTK